MPRLPYADSPDGADATLFRALAHAPEPLRRYQRLGKSLVFGSGSPDRLKELAVLAVAQRRRCEYLWSHHCDLGRAAGLTDTEIRAVRDGSPGLGPIETLVTRYAVAVEDGTVAAADTAALTTAGLDPEAIAELTLLSAFYGMTARVVAALDVGLEPGRSGFGSP